MNHTKTTIKQALAFLIDMVLISTPMFIAIILFSDISVETALLILAIPWLFYIPYAEWAFAQTLGMKMLNIAIVNIQMTDEMQTIIKPYNINRIAAKTAYRRHLARVSLIWGTIAWLLALFGKQFFDDYQVVDLSNRKVEEP